MRSTRAPSASNAPPCAPIARFSRYPRPSGALLPAAPRGICAGFAVPTLRMTPRMRRWPRRGSPQSAAMRKALQGNVFCGKTRSGSNACARFHPMRTRQHNHRRAPTPRPSFETASARPAGIERQILDALRLHALVVISSGIIQRTSPRRPCQFPSDHRYFKTSPAHHGERAHPCARSRGLRKHDEPMQHAQSCHRAPSR